MSAARRRARSSTDVAPAGDAHDGTLAGDLADADVPGDDVPGDDAATNAVERLLDRALAKGGGHAARHAEAVRHKHPGATPADLVALLERRYRRRVRVISAAVGLTAAVPGVGTLVAGLLTSANFVGFVRSSTTFIGAVAHVHGIAIDDVARRRTLLLAALLGKDGARAVSGKIGASSLYWGRGLITRLPLSTVRTVNRGLARRLARFAGAKGGAMFLGRLAPFGIGAVVGWWIGGKLAGQVIAGARDAFGPPPAA